MRIRDLKFVVVIGALALGALPNARAADTDPEQHAAQPAASWHSPSLTTETVTGGNGAVTTPTAAGANARMGITDRKVVEQVAPDVYALRGWGIAHSFAIDAPNR